MNLIFKLYKKKSLKVLPGYTGDAVRKNHIRPEHISSARERGQQVTCYSEISSVLAEFPPFK